MQRTSTDCLALISLLTPVHQEVCYPLTGGGWHSGLSEFLSGGVTTDVRVTGLSHNPEIENFLGSGMIVELVKQKVFRCLSEV